MRMLIKIAWRNLWRNKRRSAIVLLSIVVGMATIVLFDTLSMGMVNQMLRNRVGNHIGHIQIHRAGYHDNPQVAAVIPQPRSVEQAIRQTPHVRYYAPRVLAFGLASSAMSSAGIQLVGIDPQKEQHITLIASSIKKGRYLQNNPHEILISTRLAKKLNVQLGEKIVLLANTVTGAVGSDVFRVVGLYETFDSNFDRTYIYIPIAEARKLLEIPDGVHEFVIIADAIDWIPAIKEHLRGALSASLEVLSYRDIIPLLVAQLQLYQEMIAIYYVVVGLAIAFGIVNTLLMAIFERVHEIGVLMAIGMRPLKLFWMLLLEAAVLGYLGTALGLIIALLLYWPLSHTGINLAMFSESLRSFGVGAIIYPVLTPAAVVNSVVTLPLVSIVAAVYPAWRATRFQPMEAIRYV